MRAEATNRRQGFTLLELLVVLTLVSIMLAVSVPRFRSTLFSDPLKLAARQITGAVRQARQQAMTSEQGCYLTITFDEKKLQITCPAQPLPPDEEGASTSATQADEEDTAGSAVVLADEVSFESIWNGNGQRFAIDAVRLWINPRGLMEPAVINLQSGEDSIGLSFSPFLPEVRMSDSLIVPDNADEASI